MGRGEIMRNNVIHGGVEPSRADLPGSVVVVSVDGPRASTVPYPSAHLHIPSSSSQQSTRGVPRKGGKRHPRHFFMFSKYLKIKSVNVQQRIQRERKKTEPPKHVAQKCSKDFK